MKKLRPKNELIEEIKDLPEFELTEAYIKREGEYVEQQRKAVTEIGGVNSLAFVSKNYYLIQFKDVFLPIVENIEECEGEVMTNSGFARMALFPKIGTFSNDDEKWGIIAMNSVDLSSSVTIKFCLTKNGRRITLPSNMAGYTAHHTQKAAVNVQDFITVITKVKDQWKGIIDKFSDYHVTDDNLWDIMDNIAFHDKGFIKGTKKILEGGVDYRLWDLFMDLIDHISDKKYTSNVHKERRMDKLCEGIINYTYLLKI